jgi:hypothetical protein
MSVTTEQLQSRIIQMYEALGLTIEERLSEINTQVEMNAAGEAVINLNGDRTQENFQNSAKFAIYDIAVFYNHCCQWAQNTKGTTDDAEAVTENSRALRIIRDLDNTNKHPPHIANSSGDSPVLEDVRRALVVRGPMTYTQMFTGESRFEGDLHFEISGTIKNSRTGKVVGQLADILTEGVEAWEKFLTANQLLPLKTASINRPSAPRTLKIPTRINTQPLNEPLPLKDLHFVLSVFTRTIDDGKGAVAITHGFRVAKDKDGKIENLVWSFENVFEYREPSSDPHRVALQEALTLLMGHRPPGTKFGVVSTVQLNPQMNTRQEAILGDVFLPPDCTLIAPPFDAQEQEYINNMYAHAHNRFIQVLESISKVTSDQEFWRPDEGSSPYRARRGWRFHHSASVAKTDAMSNI